MLLGVQRAPAVHVADALALPNRHGTSPRVPWVSEVNPLCHTKDPLGSDLGHLQPSTFAIASPI